jgi:hypothetical protein
MTVNTLVTGMIVFKILKVVGVRMPTSVERGTTKSRDIMFLIIESGMALFAIQLVRVVLVFRHVPVVQESSSIVAEDVVIVINQMLNVIILRFVHFYFICFC